MSSTFSIAILNRTSLLPSSGIDSVLLGSAIKQYPITIIIVNVYGDNVFDIQIRLSLAICSHLFLHFFVSVVRVWYIYKITVE